MGIIKKENDEAFWLGAEVGQTESVSHIPTQMTSYKGINAPLTNWEYSFFKGYLLRYGQVKKPNRVCLRITDHVKSIKAGTVSGYAYIQNAHTYDSSCRFILLNSNKEKIDRQGNVLPNSDKSCYGTKFSSDFSCDLPSGQYYYREIRIFKSRLIEDDIPFIVVDSDSVQYVYIDHSPNIFKMYYKGIFTEEDVFPDLSKYYREIERTTSNHLSMYYYKRSNTLSLNYTYTMKPLWRITYDILNLEYNGENVSNLFEFGWKNDKLGTNNCGHSNLRGNPDCMTSIEVGDKAGVVYKGKNDSLPEDRYDLYCSYELDTSDVTLPTYMFVKYLPTSQSYQTNARSYYISESPKYVGDVRWDEIIQIGVLEGENTGYMIVHNHISGTSCTTYNSSVSTKKKYHYTIKQTSWTETTIKKIKQEESYMWEGSHDDQTTITGGETNTYSSPATLTSPADAIKFIGGRAARVYFADKIIQDLPTLLTLFYYESNSEVVEVCSTYDTHIDDAGNPTISDENISKAFIGTTLVYNQIKQGYEDYNF